MKEHVFTKDRVKNCPIAKTNGFISLAKYEMNNIKEYKFYFMGAKLLYELIFHLLSHSVTGVIDFFSL